MKPRTWIILEQAISNGLKLGYRRATKHNENATEEDILEHQIKSIMGQIYEYFTFDDENC